jgi:hypothetical protein
LSAPYSTLDTPRLFQVEVANDSTARAATGPGPKAASPGRPAVTTLIDTADKPAFIRVENGLQPVRFLGVTGDMWDQRGQLRESMKPAIANVVHIAPEVSREMDGIDRVVKDLVRDEVENEVRDAIGNASAELDDTPQDHAGSDT